MANTYYTSTGEPYTDIQIKRKLSRERKGWMIRYVCECYGAGHQADDADHTISQKRCKELHKVELIWDENNISFSSRKAHEEWERYKSGKFSNHKNVMKRMKYVATHDPETFWNRFYWLSKDKQEELLLIIE